MRALRGALHSTQFLRWMEGSGSSKGQELCSIFESVGRTTLGRCAHLRGASGQQREVPLVQAALASVLPHHRVYRQVTVHQRVMEPPAQKRDIFSSPYLDLVSQLRLLLPPIALMPY